MKIISDKILDERLSDLPLDVGLSKDLWPEVSRQLAGQRRRTQPVMYAMAAAVLLVCLGSGLTWSVMRARHTPSPSAALNTSSNFGEPSDPALASARANLEKTFHERMAVLDPDTRAHINASLAVIHKAHEEIADALAGTPGSPVLEQLFASTWHDEFDLYDDVVRSTQPTLARN